MTWSFHSGRGSRVAMLAAGVGAVFAASISFAPAAGAEASGNGPGVDRPAQSQPQGALASGLEAVSC